MGEVGGKRKMGPNWKIAAMRDCENEVLDASVLGYASQGSQVERGRRVAMVGTGVKGNIG